MKKYISLVIACCISAVVLKAQNPQIIKAVDGTVEFPKSTGSSFWRTNEWKGLFFYQGTGSPTKLCVTDGTNAGTKFLKDISPLDANISFAIPARDFMYLITRRIIISGSSYQTQDEIWKSDGTTAGTVLVYSMPLYSGPTLTNIFVSNFTTLKNYSVSGNNMFFAGADLNVTGQELWMTDGTPGGTHIVKDIRPGAAGSIPGGFSKIGGLVFFAATTDGVSLKLWQTDGTANGTVQVYVPEPFNIKFGQFGMVNNKIFFRGAENSFDNEPYISDGTPAGTFRLADINPGTSGSFPSYGPAIDFASTGKYLFFIAVHGGIFNLWRTDGTQAGTIPITPDSLNTQTYASSNSFDLNDTLLYFTNSDPSGNTLYVSNGTAAGTRLVKKGIINPDYLKIYQNAVWFQSSLTASNVEPWRSDGTTINTNQALDVYPGGINGQGFSSEPAYFFVKNNKLYFFGKKNPVRNLYCYTGDFTFNGQTVGGKWSDSTNWNSRMPPGITDTVFINTGTANALNITGAKAYAGVLQTGIGAQINLAGVIDSLIVNNKIITAGGNIFGGAGSLVLKNNSDDTVFVEGSGFTANNIVVASASDLISGDITVSNSLKLNSGNICLNNNNIVMNGTASTAVGSSASFINTNGTGSMQIQNVGVGARTTEQTFPIGNGTNYNPVSLTNAGSPDKFSARVIQGIFGAYTGETPGTQSFASGAVNSTFFINEDVSGGSDVSLNLQWNQVQELTAFDRTQAFVSHYTGGNWDVTTPAAASGTNPYSFSRTGISSFSPFSVKNTFSVLPIKFLQLTARALQDRQNIIVWRFSDQQGLAEQEIQRSADGIVFNKIGIVKTFSANGQYIFYDNNVITSKTFYRVVAISVDARRINSNIASVEKASIDATGLLKISPNPATNYLNVEIPSDFLNQPISIKVFDTNGKLVKLLKLENAANSNVSIDVTQLGKGNYVIEIKGKSAKKATTFIVL